MNSTVDIFLRISEDKNNYFCFVLILTKITFQIYEALTRTVFQKSVLFLISEWYLQDSKDTFYLAWFCFYLHFEHFHTQNFFSSRKTTTGIFSHLLSSVFWTNFRQTFRFQVKKELSFHAYPYLKIYNHKKEPYE